MTTTKNPEMVRALVADRWDQATVVPVPDRDRGSGIQPSELLDRLDAALLEFAARLAGGEVVAFGMARVMDELEDTIRERLCAWAVAYTLGELDAEIAAESGTVAA